METENDLSEDLLGEPQSTAEHVAANIGLSSFLQGQAGIDYNPKDSPLNYINKKGENTLYRENFPNEPQKAAVLTELNNLKNKTISDIQKGAKSIFGNGDTLDIEKSNAKSFHDSYEDSGNLNSNPETLNAHLANQTMPISEHAPNTTIFLSGLASKASSLLQQLKPDLSKKAPLDSDRKANQVQIADYNRAAHLLDNPLAIMNAVKDGTLSQANMGLMKEVYPNLLQSIQKEVFSQLAEHQTEEKPITFQTKMSLSRLLGQPMDSSLNNIGKNQMVFMTMNGQKMAEQQGGQGPGKPSKSGISKYKVSNDETRYQQASARRA